MLFGEDGSFKKALSSFSSPASSISPMPYSSPWIFESVRMMVFMYFSLFMAFLTRLPILLSVISASLTLSRAAVFSPKTFSSAASSILWYSSIISTANCFWPFCETFLRAVAFCGAFLRAVFCLAVLCLLVSCMTVFFGMTTGILFSMFFFSFSTWGDVFFKGSEKR